MIFDTQIYIPSVQIVTLVACENVKTYDDKRKIIVFNIIGIIWIFDPKWKKKKVYFFFDSANFVCSEPNESRAKNERTN